MRYLLAPDSFKEAADARTVAEAMRRGILAGDPDAECRVMPLSDGGEGLTAALVDATAGKLRSAHVHDALGRPIVAQYGFLGNSPESNASAQSDGGTDARTAVVELAAASGLERIRPADRDPLAASTFGTGELIRDAIDEGAERIVLGLGGSATTDGGTGLAHALGYRFLDSDDCELRPGGGALPRLARIDDADVPNAIRGIPFVLACDVTNPLTGPRGAAAVFAPQKGADAQQVALLDAGLGRLAEAIDALNGRRIANLPGSGAAGGTGGGMLGLFNATMRPGIELTLDLLHADEACAWADAVITGEGSIDAQTPYGKVPSGIAQLARSLGKPTVAIGGKVTRDPQVLDALCEAGIVATFGIAPGPAGLPELLADTERNVESTCAAIAGLLRTSPHQTSASPIRSAGSSNRDSIKNRNDD